MSDLEEIQAVYQDDIDRQCYILERKEGKRPFYDNFKGMSIRRNIDYDPSKTKYQGEK
jgi:hypothetical protein